MLKTPQEELDHYNLRVRETYGVEREKVEVNLSKDILDVWRVINPQADLNVFINLCMLADIDGRIWRKKGILLFVNPRWLEEL